MKNGSPKKLMAGVLRTIIWRQDVSEGEMIQRTGYTEDYLDPYEKGGVKQAELTLICATVNETFRATGSTLRVTNSMGEIIPATFNYEVLL